MSWCLVGDSRVSPGSGSHPLGSASTQLVPLCLTGQGFNPKSAGRDSETLTSINDLILKILSKIFLFLCSFVSAQGNSEHIQKATSLSKILRDGQYLQKVAQMCS